MAKYTNTHHATSGTTLADETENTVCLKKLTGCTVIPELAANTVSQNTIEKLAGLHTRCNQVKSIPQSN